MSSRQMNNTNEKVLNKSNTIGGKQRNLHGGKDDGLFFVLFIKKKKSKQLIESTCLVLCHIVRILLSN